MRTLNKRANVTRLCWSWPCWFHMITPLWMSCLAKWWPSSYQLHKHSTVLFVSQMTVLRSFTQRFSIYNIKKPVTRSSVPQGIIIILRDCETNDMSYIYAKYAKNSLETLNGEKKIPTDQCVNKPSPISKALQTRSFICTPIIGKSGDDVIGLCQLVYKRNMSLPKADVFNTADKRLLEDFAVYCALGLQRFNTQQMAEKTRAKLAVTKEGFSCQISASQEKLQALREGHYSISRCSLSTGFWLQ